MKWTSLNTVDLDQIRKILDIRLYFEGPSDWSVREFIEIINDYFFERLPIILNNVLEPYNMEASVLSEDEACRILKDNCQHRIVVAIYRLTDNKLVLYVIYWYRIGDNTFEFQLEKVITT